MSEKCGIAWGDGLLQMNNRGKGNVLLSRERDLRWLVNMVAMFRCVYAEEAGKLGSWEAGKLGKSWRGGRSPHRASRIPASSNLIISVQ